MSTVLQNICDIHLIIIVSLIVLILQENQLLPPGKCQVVEEGQGFEFIKSQARMLGCCVLAMDLGAGFLAPASHSGENREKNTAFEGLL